MKKTLLLLFAFILIGCSSNDPLTKYLKEDIVLETGSKVSVANLLKEDEDIADKDLREAMNNATIAISFNDNQLIDMSKIKSDKIFATNTVHLSYKYRNKVKEKKIDVKVKDTTAPIVTLSNYSYFNLVNTITSKEDFISNLALKVVDNGNYSVDIEGFDKIDFTQVNNHNLKLIVSDEANNIVIKDISLFVGKEPKIITFRYPNNTITLTVPSSITSYYNVSDYQPKVLGNSKVTFTNDLEQLNLTIPYPFNLEYYRHDKINEYSINNYNVQLFKPAKTNTTTNEKNNDYGKKENLAAIVSKQYPDLGFVVEISKGENKGQLKWFVDTIATNISIK